MGAEPEGEWTVDSAGARVPARLMLALRLSVVSVGPGEWRWATGSYTETRGGPGLRFLACLEPDGQVSVSLRDDVCWLYNEAGQREEALRPVATDDVRLLRVRWYEQGADDLPDPDPENEEHE